MIKCNNVSQPIHDPCDTPKTPKPRSGRDRDTPTPRIDAYVWWYFGKYLYDAKLVVVSNGEYKG